MDRFRLCLPVAWLLGMLLTATSVATATAGDWHPRGASAASTELPDAARPPATPHLVIRTPPVVPQRQPWLLPPPADRHVSDHHSPNHHPSASEILPLPVQPEAVGGGYWEPFAPGANEPSPPPTPAAHAVDRVHQRAAEMVTARQDHMPAAPALPGATQVTGWKQPYAYGYFGAKHNRQRSVHHGHQRTFTQWTFR